MQPAKLMFLPGASGNTAFWQPVAERLAHPGERLHVGWPGFGSTPPDPAVNGLDDLVARVITAMDSPTALIAQSMGGVIAMRAALAKPEYITHLVLTATSGGLDLNSFDVEDWRPALQAEQPALPAWFAEDRQDLSAQLGRIAVPVLLLWGDADPISPVAVGERLAALLPDAALHVCADGEHDLAYVHAEQVAPLIDAHLNR